MKTENLLRNSGYVVVPFDLERHIEAISEIFNQEAPEPLPASMLRDRILNTPPGSIEHRAVIESVDGRVVANGIVKRRQQQPPGTFHLWLATDRDYWGQGFGGDLYNLLERKAKSLGATRLLTHYPEKCDRAHPFVVKRGFVETQRLFASTVDVGSVDPKLLEDALHRAESQHIAIVDWATLGDTEAHRRELFDVVDESDRDTPGIADWGLATYEEYVNMTFNGSAFDPHLLLVAVADGKMLGMHQSMANGEGIWTTEYTGVIARARGRGIARALKAEIIRRAGAQNIMQITTFNDTLNQPMLHVNRSLGFQTKPGTVCLVKELA